MLNGYSHEKRSGDIRRNKQKTANRILFRFAAFLSFTGRPYMKEALNIYIVQRFFFYKKLKTNYLVRAIGGSGFRYPGAIVRRIFNAGGVFRH